MVKTIDNKRLNKFFKLEMSKRAKWHIISHGTFYFWVTLVLLSLSFVILYRLVFLNIEAKHEWHYQFGILNYDLCLAFLMGMFIYFITVFLPNTKNKIAIQNAIFQRARDSIIPSFYTQLKSMRDKFGLILEVGLIDPFKLSLRDDVLVRILADPDKKKEFDLILIKIKHEVFKELVYIQKAIVADPGNCMFQYVESAIHSELYLIADKVKYDPNFSQYGQFKFLDDYYYIMTQFEYYVKSIAHDKDQEYIYRENSSEG